MSGSALMSLGTRAMFASYAQLQTTSNNIANANVKGYSRQEVELTTSAGQYTGAGFFGKGVDVATVKRSYDDFLNKQSLSAQSVSLYDQTRYQQLQQLENVFPTGTDGVGATANAFLNALSDVASNPSDSSARQVVLTRAKDLAARFTNAGVQLDDLQNGVKQDLTNSVATVNGITAQIAKVNQQIAAVQGTGHAPNDLLDQRDQLVSQLSQFMQVTTIPASDGSLGVFIAGGQRLVLGAQALQLKVVPDTFDAAKAGIGIVEANGTRLLPTDMLSGGGSIGGLLKFQDEDLTDARNLLGQMASAISAAVNKQQSLGLDLETPASAGAPIFSAGAPRALPANTNARDASGNFVGSVQLTVTDASQLQASDYELRNDPSGTGFIVTRLSDGLTRTINDGDVVDGMQINVTGTWGGSDRFLLQPVGRAAADMKMVMDDPRGIAAASPVTATLGAANTGTASIASVTATSMPLPAMPLGLHFTDDSGGYEWLDSGGTQVGTGTWTAGQPISYGGVQVTLNGVPKTDDTVGVDATKFPGSNNGNALAMMNIRDQAIVDGSTMTDAYANAIANVGVRVQSAKSASDLSAAAYQQAEDQRAGQSGVNLDEEAARLIQFQQNYQAAAKVLDVAQKIFDTLLNMGS